MPTLTLPEAEISAPRADAMLHVMRMHVRAHGDSIGHTAARLETLTVLALIEDYQPEDIPTRFLGAFETALDLLVTSRARNLQARAIRQIPNRRAPWEAEHEANLSRQADDEARRIIRRTITLEGQDL